MRPRALAAALAVLVAGAARAASPFPTRSGESGLLDVPDAETLGTGSSILGAEYRLDHAPGAPDQLGPFPVSFVTGAGRWDLGAAFREGGGPGDPRPSPILFGIALKRSIVPRGLGLPPLAMEVTLDRLNRDPVAGLRVLVSEGGAGPVRLAGYAGFEAFGATGFTGGVAAAVPLPGRLEAVAQAATGPRGAILGGAIRWRINDRLGISVTYDRLPREQGYRASLGLGFLGAPVVRPVKPAAPTARPGGEEEEPPKPGEPVFADDRPHFRIRLAVAPLHVGQPRHAQVTEYAGPTVSAVVKPTAAPARPAAPTAEDMFDAQLRDTEAAVDARSKRLRSTEDGLASRDAAVAAGQKRNAAREKDLADGEQELEARERRIKVRGPVPVAERQLEAREAQLGASERQLAAQARGFQPAIDAAEGRERSAAQRASDERADSERLLAQSSQGKSRTEQLDLRKQALAARQRALAADEARLIAKGERLDAVERQLRTREEILDGWQRRLDTRRERLELVERRAADQARPPDKVEKPTSGAPGAPTDKSVFVMVVKSPTAILKEQSGKPHGPEGGVAPLHPGVSVEKAVAAATVLYFPTSATQLSELDREGLESIARLAAKEGCEILVWARAKDPSLMSEATRRASEIKALLVKMAEVPEKQIVTRITTRPGAQGVDVVVSALRGQKASGGAAEAPAQPSDGTGELGTGETAKRKLRDAVQSYQRDIERCIGMQLVMRKIESAEVLLKLAVDPDGKVTKASVEEGPLAGEEVRACLGGAAKKWTFPKTGAEYSVDVPITVVAPGKKP